MTDVIAHEQLRAFEASDTGKEITRNLMKSKPAWNRDGNSQSDTAMAGEYAFDTCSLILNYGTRLNVQSFAKIPM